MPCRKRRACTASTCARSRRANRGLHKAFVDVLRRALECCFTLILNCQDAMQEYADGFELPNWEI